MSLAYAQVLLDVLVVLVRSLNIKPRSFYIQAQGSGKIRVWKLWPIHMAKHNGMSTLSSPPQTGSTRNTITDTAATHRVYPRTC